jgi:hypothetical protein
VQDLLVGLGSDERPALFLRQDEKLVHQLRVACLALGAVRAFE